MNCLQQELDEDEQGSGVHLDPWKADLGCHGTITMLRCVMAVWVKTVFGREKISPLLHKQRDFCNTFTDVYCMKYGAVNLCLNEPQKQSEHLINLSTCQPQPERASEAEVLDEKPTKVRTRSTLMLLPELHQNPFR
ncbi:hypothetical protein JZ751_021194 [Albula glossodonta]|uniref:Uncharacterized protein n=1 Tax=Albula glossodonta TaxID=121402 RepID=A0A8T2NSW6_9TELE|nr:hypothetical protein JZ751_021194 [Albula glossodonta]